MKHHLLLVSILLIASSCGRHHQQTSPQQMDPDFEPTEPHPFAERIDQSSGTKLTPNDFALHGDTIGPLVILRAEPDTGSYLLHSFSFCLPDGAEGTATCEYNEFNELVDLFISSAQQSTHSRLQWNDDGNLTTVNQESWLSIDGTSIHTLQNIEYRYGQQCAYGNWYGDMAEKIGGPLSLIIHAGLLGRAPWTLPEATTYVCSTIQGDMIGEQQTYNYKSEYEFDNNGRVVKETLTIPQQQSHSYQYTY